MMMMISFSSSSSPSVAAVMKVSSSSCKSMLLLLAVIICFLSSWQQEVNAFTSPPPPTTGTRRITTTTVFERVRNSSSSFQVAASQSQQQQQQRQQQKRSSSSSSSSSTRLYSSSNNNNNNFDISRPTFDLYTLRQIRGDALIRYNSLNQSEPLRINIYLILLITAFSFPTLSEAVLDQQATLPQIALSVLGGGFASYRFVRECLRRSNKLNKIEKECNAQSLKVRLPMNLLKSNPFEEKIFAPTPLQLQQVLPNRYRILAICGPTNLLKQSMTEVQALRRRLQQAKVLIVPVPTDLTSSSTSSSSSSSSSLIRDYMFTELDVNMDVLKSVPCIAETVDVNEWVDYFSALLDEDNEENNDNDDNMNKKVVGNQLVWFGLSSSGKSFGSGIGNIRWLEVLGQSLLPQDVLDPDDPTFIIMSDDDGDDSNEEASKVLEAQTKFYDALINGNLEQIKNDVFSKDTSKQVSEVLSAGGSLDDWTLCLREGARPADMIVADSDVFLSSSDDKTTTKAYTTTIEFPIKNDSTASLLAVQEWIKLDNDGQWKLSLHQTIPWGPDTNAGATLRCDCRGCTALAKTTSGGNWNFRGMID